MRVNLRVRRFCPCATFWALVNGLMFVWIHFFFLFGPMPPHVLVDFVVLPPGHGRSVTDFSVWDAHEAQMWDVSGDVGGCNARRALKPKFYQPTQTMVTAGILPFRENFHDRAGSRTRDLMISSQRLCSLDHETGQDSEIYGFVNWHHRFISAFASFQKATISFVVSVRPFAWNNWAPTRRIFMKFDIWVFLENRSRKF